MKVLLLVAVIFACAPVRAAVAQANAPLSPPPPVAPAVGLVPLPHVRRFKAVDADNRTVVLNRPGFVTLLLGTSEDSQDKARSAGKAMYSLQGRPDFQLIVVVDLRDSIATWVPTIVTEKMRSNLDNEAIELKPYFVKNGNRSDPRKSLYVIPDFSGTISPQLGWIDTSENLRGILFGADSREIVRWDKIDDMAKLQTDVRAAVQVLVDADKLRAAIAAKTQGTKLIQPSTAHPPLLPPVAITDSN